MWFKRTYYDEASKVPFIISWPGVIPGSRRISQVVSLVDLYPTLCELADTKHNFSQQGFDGHSFAKLLLGADVGMEWKDEAICEYLGEGILQPMRMLRSGRYKYVHVNGSEPQLFDMLDDPNEMRNLSALPELKEIEAALRKRILQGWDAEALVDQVMQSQQNRIRLIEALSQGVQTSWDWKPRVDPSKQYVRYNSQLENQINRL
jgi:choline-sulfatase